MTGFNEALEYVIENADPSNQSPLSAVIQAFVASGVDLNARWPDGKTAMYAAAEKGLFELVHYLLHKGVNPNIYADSSSGEREGLIHYLARKPFDLLQDDYIDELMSGFKGLGVDMNLPLVETGKTAAHLLLTHPWDAAQIDADGIGRHEEWGCYVERLMCVGLRLDVVDTNGRSPLHDLMESRAINGFDRLRRVDFLTEKGVSLNQRDCEGITPFMIYMSNCLADGGCRNPLGIQQFIDRGFDPLEVDDAGRNVFMHMFLGHECMKEGVDLSFEDQVTKCAAMLPALKVLLVEQSGVDIVSKDNDGRTVFDYCDDFIQGRDVKGVSMLYTLLEQYVVEQKQLGLNLTVRHNEYSELSL